MEADTKILLQPLTGMNVCGPAAPSTSMIAPSESTVTMISVMEESTAGVDAVTSVSMAGDKSGKDRGNEETATRLGLLLQDAFLGGETRRSTGRVEPD